MKTMKYNNTGLTFYEGDLVNPNGILNDKGYERRCRHDQFLLPSFVLNSNSKPLPPSRPASPITNQVATQVVPAQTCINNITKPPTIRHDDPCLLRSATDYLHRIALISYILRKKVSSFNCRTCDRTEIPSSILPSQDYNEWVLPFEALSESTPIEKREGHDNSLKLTSAEVANVASMIDPDSRFAGVLHFRTVSCRQSDLDRREEHEILIVNVLAVRLREYVCFPIVATKQENNYNHNKQNHYKHAKNSNSWANDSPNISINLLSSPEVSRVSMIRPVDSNRKRRPIKYQKKEPHEADITIQNTVDYFMNMSSPIKSESIDTERSSSTRENKSCYCDLSRQLDDL